MLLKMTSNGTVTSKIMNEAVGRVDKQVDLFYLAVQINQPLHNPDDFASLRITTQRAARANAAGRTSSARTSSSPPIPPSRNTPRPPRCWAGSGALKQRCGSRRGARRVVRPARSLGQRLALIGVSAAQPLVSGLARDLEASGEQRHVRVFSRRQLNKFPSERHRRIHLPCGMVRNLLPTGSAIMPKSVYPCPRTDACYPSPRPAHPGVPGEGARKANAITLGREGSVRNIGPLSPFSRPLH